MLNITGDSVARVCKVPENILPARVNQHVAIIRAKKDQLIPEFLLYYLIFQKEELLSQSEIGATRRAITKGMIGSFTINLPPLPEQKAIASVLNSLDDKIDLLHRQNATLEKIAETLFRQWFVEEAVEALKDTTLDTHTEVIRGLSYKGSGLSDYGVGLPMHNLNSVYEGGGYKHEGIKFYSGDYQTRHLISPGNIIVTNTEQGHDFKLIGFPAIVTNSFGPNGLFSQHLFKLIPKSGTYLSNQFIYYLLMSPNVREQITAATNGSTVNMLSIDGLQRPVFKLPSKDMVIKFTSVVSNCWKKQEMNHDQIRTLITLRDTLLPKLMTGEVRVKM